MSWEASPETHVEQEPEANETVAAEAAPPEEKISTNDFADDTPNATNGGETSNAIAADTAQKRPGLKTLAEGTVLNSRYEIVRKIGGGGMGAVYLALDKNLNGVERAVKEMVHTSIEEEQQKKAIEDFRRESMILSTLDHPTIPTIYDYFFDEGESRFYLVMKYISGGDLAGRLFRVVHRHAGGALDQRFDDQRGDVFGVLF